MDPRTELGRLLTRRAFLGRSAAGIAGLAALSDLLAQDRVPSRGPHFAPRARRLVYLVMSGAPSQMDMWDYKPAMADWYDKDFPESVRRGQRLTTMTSGQKRFPIAPSVYRFARHGRHGTWVSELLPHTAGVVDRLCVIRSMWTDAINHDPGITFFQTGAEQPGRPSLGAWLAYGLGSINRDLPAFVVMTPSWTGRREAQALYTRLWGAGFLPGHLQGVALRAQDDPVLYLSNPPGVDATVRRRALDTLAALNERALAREGDPEIATRIAQYELAFRMQTAVPELTDLSGESEATLAMYGPDVHRPGTFARCSLLARRLLERGVRVVQLFHRGWDQHENMTGNLPKQCRDVDQACAALILDLEQRGLLDDTLVVWGGEFGRTVYCQGPLSRENYGRDHHPRCFTMWLAGGGIRPGHDHGETDEFSYNIVRDPVHVHDLNATLLHCLGIDHERLTYRFQGRDFRLTDVHGRVVRDLLA
jgi:hypothetical protein